MQKIQIITFLTALIWSNTVAAEDPRPHLNTVNSSAIWAQMSFSGAKLQDSDVESAAERNGFVKIPSILPRGEMGEPNFSMPTNSAGTRELFFKMMVSVVVVVVLGGVALYASKRLVGKISNLPGRKIKIVETAHLGPRKAVHLLRIGDRCLLIGSTNDNITRLADLTTEICIQEALLGKEADPTDTHETGHSREFELAPGPNDALADLSSTYVEEN